MRLTAIALTSPRGSTTPESAQLRRAVLQGVACVREQGTTTSAAGSGRMVRGWSSRPSGPAHPACQAAMRSTPTPTGSGGTPTRQAQAAVSTRPRWSLRDMTLVTRPMPVKPRCLDGHRSGTVRTMSSPESDTVGAFGHAVSPLNH
jgi:hypothetical protein